MPKPKNHIQTQPSPPQAKSIYPPQYSNKLTKLFKTTKRTGVIHLICGAIWLPIVLCITIITTVLTSPYVSIRTNAGDLANALAHLICSILTLVEGFYLARSRQGRPNLSATQPLVIATSISQLLAIALGITLLGFSLLIPVLFYIATLLICFILNLRLIFATHQTRKHI